MDALDAVQNAIDFIDDNLCEELSQEVIASHAYMSNFEFQKFFSIFFGITLGEYIRNRRLTEAALEMKGKKVKVIELSLRYGYESPESFTRAFSRFHGVSPMAVRSQEGEIRKQQKLSVKKMYGGKEAMKGLTQRGYTVKENGPVYYTMDMDRTAKWFEEVLGWYVNIDARNEEGKGTYGCALPVPGELVNMHITSFNGIHLFYGEPSTKTVAFMNVIGLVKLVEFVKNSGWTGVSEITTEPWGAMECDVTTIDGGVMRFFELMNE